MRRREVGDAGIKRERREESGGECWEVKDEVGSDE